MYRNAVVALLISTLIVMLLDVVVVRILFRRKSETVVLLRASSLGTRAIRILVSWFAFLSFAAVAGTGFYSLLTGEGKLTGYRLMMHVGAAPAFAAGGVLVTLFWAHRNRFTAADWNRLRRPLRHSELDGSSYALVWRKLFFWITVALAVPAAVSITLAMFPVLGPSGQEDLFLIHRYCVLPLAVAAILFTYFSFVVRIGRHTE